MGRREKSFARLEALEAAFLGRLRAALDVSARGSGDFAFLSARVLPSAWPRTMQSIEADELADSADDLVALYKQLGVPSTGTPAVTANERH